MSIVSLLDRQVYTPGSYTWTKPAGAVLVRVTIAGGGGGGGSGVRRASFTTRGGGGAGSGGHIISATYFADDLGATEGVTVGVGGAGGAGQTTNDTAGITGSPGGVSQFSTGPVALGGLPGTGALLSGAAGSAGAQRDNNFGTSAAALWAYTWNLPLSGWSLHGSQGGGVTSSNIPVIIASSPPGGAHLGTTDTSYQVFGGSPVSHARTLTDHAYGILPMYSGSGGTGGESGAGGAGGTGQGYAAGGGGGGGCVNGFTSGAGGAGAPGLVLVETYGNT